MAIARHGRRRFVTLAVTALLLTAAPPSAARTHDITYTVETRGAVTTDLRTFAELARATLADPRGWSLGGAVSYRQVRSGGQFRLVLATPDAVAAASPGCNARWSCRVGDLVLINEQRWNTGTATWPGALRDYRHYVVNHEVGHWLGLGHRSCPGRGSPAPVMQQQSIRLDGCSANTWPLPSETRAVALARGIPAAHVSTPSPAGTVRYGDRGPAVGQWQRELNRVLPGTLAVDQVFGPRTLRSTRELQRRAGIAVDGVVGPQTRRAARAAAR